MSALSLARLARPLSLACLLALAASGGRAAPQTRTAPGDAAAAEQTAAAITAGPAAAAAGEERVSFGSGLRRIAARTGLAAFLARERGAVVMLATGLLLLYLGVARGFEPLLLVPIGFGCIFINAPFAGMGSAHGLLGLIYRAGIENDLLPLLIFMGIGAMSDFSPLLGNPRVLLLGAAAQLGVFGTLLGVVALNALPGIGFTLKEACAVAIIGAADGPTSIIVGRRFAPGLIGPIAVAAYSYMALVPLIQPPVMRLLTTRRERLIRMRQERQVSRRELLLFPVMILLVCVVFLPAAVSLMGCLAFGNFVRECGVVERLSKGLQNEVMNIATILLGLGVGMQLEAARFLQPATLGILAIGLAAFALGTAGGVIFAKLMNILAPRNPVNPLIGAAGVSAFPMAARVATRLAMEHDPRNVLLMHALGANVAGQIGSIVTGGVIMALFG